MFVDGIDAAVALEQVRRALFAHAFDARHVVRLVADQRLQVNELLGRQAVLLLDRLRGVEDGVAEPASACEDGRLLGDTLHDVPVAGDDDRVNALFIALARQGAEHIVGLKALGREDRDVENAHHVLDSLDLLAQIVGHALAMPFVVGVVPVAKGFAHVEGHRDVLRLHVAQDVEQHGEKAESCVSRLSGARGHVRRQGVVSPEGK